MGHVGAIGMEKFVRSAKAFIRVTNCGHTAPQFSRSGIEPGDHTIGRSDRICGHWKKLNQASLASKIEEVRRSCRPRRNVAFRLVLIRRVQGFSPGRKIHWILPFEILGRVVLRIAVGITHG
jgi:hypothetical protein